MTTTRAHNLAHTIGSSWALMAVTIAIQIAHIPLALAFLSKDEFGLATILYQLLALVGLMDMGVTTAFVRLLVGARIAGKDRYQRVWHAGLGLLAIQGFLMLIAVTVLCRFLPGIFSLPDRLASVGTVTFLAMGVLCALGHPFTIYRTTLVAHQQMMKTNWIALVTQVLQFLALVVALKMGCGLPAYICSTAVTALLPGALCMLMCVRNSIPVIPRRTHFDWICMKELFSLGVDMIFLVLSNTVVHGSFLALAGLVMPLDKVAVLAVNLKPVQLMMHAIYRIPASAHPILSDLVSREDIVRYRFGWTLGSKIALTGSVLGAALYAVAAQQIITAWTSSAFLMAPSQVAMLCLFPLRHTCEALLVNALVQFKAVRRVRWWFLLEAAAFVLVVLSVGRSRDASGIVLAYLVSFLIGATLPGANELWRHTRFPNAALRDALVALTWPVTLVLMPALVFLRSIWALSGGALAALLGGVAIAGCTLAFTTVMTREETAYVGNALVTLLHPQDREP